jgi:hypothetical protein
LHFMFLEQIRVTVTQYFPHKHTLFERAYQNQTLR